MLFTLLLLLLWFLNELSGLWVSRLEFGLNGLVLPERFGLSRVRLTLVGATTLLALVSLLCRLLSLLSLVLISLIAHS